MLQRRAAGWCLLALLVIAPWLGALHAVVHPAIPVGVSALQDRPHGLDAALAGVQGEAAGSHGLGRLFGPHDAGDCRVYDQLLHADMLLSSPPAAVSAVWMAVRFAALPQPAARCGSVVFEARAPPSAR